MLKFIFNFLPQAVFLLKFTSKLSVVSKMLIKINYFLCPSAILDRV